MMTGNQYGQQWAPNSQPLYQQYDDRGEQRQWQENGRGRAQGSHNQDYQRYNEQPQSRNGYGPGSPRSPPRNNGNGQWQGQGQHEQPGGYQEPHYEQNGGSGRPPHQEYSNYRQPHNRQYQYDERYRANGQSRPSQPDHSYPDPSNPHRDQWASPSSRQKRPRARDRILTEPTSPKNLAWDNPFGAFQAKHRPDKEHKHERHASLDHAMANMNMNERRNSGGPMPRPQTSNGNRKEVPRPSTSHDRRPDMGPFHAPPLPPPQSQGYPDPVGRDSPEMNYQQPLSHRPQGELNSPRMRPSGPSGSRGPAPPGPPFQPPMVQDRPRLDPGMQYGGRDGHQNQRRNPPQGQYPPPDRRRNKPMYDEGYGSDYIPQSKAHISPVERGQAGSQYPPALNQNYHQDSYRGPPENFNAPSKAPNNRESNGLPNFDAIPAHVNEKSEDNIIANQSPNFDQNIYQKPTYQIPGSFPSQQAEQPSQIDTRQTYPSPPNQTTSPLADFSFNLPPSNPLQPSNRNENAQQGLQRQPGYDPQIPSSRTAPSGFGDSRPPGLPNSQYPPRSASRNGMKPSMESDRPPMPNAGQPYRSFSQDQYPNRPHTSNAQRPPQQSYEAMNPYEQDPMNRAPSAPAAPLPVDQGYGPTNQNSRYHAPYPQGAPIQKQTRRPSQDNYGQPQQGQPPYGQGPPPMRSASQDNYNQGPPRLGGNASAHPVPVRHYPTTNTNVNVNPNNNPDALPPHPTPARGGPNNFNNPNGYPPAQPPPVQATQMRDVSGPAPPVTLQELNSLRATYGANPNDYALGLKLAKKMVEAAKILSDEGGRADAKTTQKNREKYIFDVHKLVKKMVAANNPDAMFYLADCHGQGMLGLPVDPKEAFTLYQSAAKLNHPQSAYRVAVCCELGSEEGGGTRRDPLKAMQWYKRAATLGDPPAMYKMGMILLKGLLGQQKNPREAVSWLKRAAERADKDNPHALHELGLLYESQSPPDNILRDERYALSLFQQAAELGYKYSQFRLGSAYEYGLLECPIDSRQSIAWYTRAAAQSEHQSELALSGWYLTGSEPLLTQSDHEAFLWARKAASSGLAKAEYAMGYFNEVGIGTSVDIEEAKRWYYRAASQNFTKARERLEELKRGGPKQQKTRMSRSNVTKQSEGECSVM